MAEILVTLAVLAIFFSGAPPIGIVIALVALLLIYLARRS